MADRPIIFSGAMVRAILAGRKSQTRRVLKLQPIPFAVDDKGTLCDVGLLHVEGDRLPRITLGRVVTMQEVPFAVGDRLWVRETWQTGSGYNGPQVAYRATADAHDIDAWDGEDEGAGPSFNYDRLPGLKWHTWLPDLLSGVEGSWRSPIHMPRALSRLTLEVTGVRVERLQDISCADAIAEGIAPAANSVTIDCDTPDPREDYRSLWNSIHGKDAWDANPWVAAITFRPVSVPPSGGKA